MGVRSWIYDRALLPLTAGWYREVIERLPAGSRVLDVGIGTGGALAANAELVRDRALHFVGVDIDPDYVRQARSHVDEAGLQEHVEVCLQSIYDFDQPGFDAVYFSASFMLMPDPKAALEHVMGLLADDGQVFFTQTFQEKPSPVMNRVKPLLKKVTTVDFGQVTYEADFLATLDAAGLSVVENETIGRARKWSYRLVVGRPAEA